MKRIVNYIEGIWQVKECYIDNVLIEKVYKKKKK